MVRADEGYRFRALGIVCTPLLSQLSTAGSMPCAPGSPRIYVDEPEEFKSLWSKSLTCAERGLCFTEAQVATFFIIDTVVSSDLFS